MNKTKQVHLKLTRQGLAYPPEEPFCICSGPCCGVVSAFFFLEIAECLASIYNHSCQIEQAEDFALVSSDTYTPAIRDPFCSFEDTQPSLSKNIKCMIIIIII